MTIYSGKSVSHLGPTETEDAGLEFWDHICHYFSYMIHKKENKSQIRSIPVYYCICPMPYEKANTSQTRSVCVAFREKGQDREKEK